jgi:D-alanyl-lipoteichoic acid acyltransferase DltB (MBOAT superfamily)
LIVSGPIERSYNILPQLADEKKFDYDKIKSGLILVTLGFFKKAVIADRLSVLVEKVFNSPEEFRGVSLIAGAILFSIQIYCDFSGYTDIAIGIAKIMGIDVMENFNLPYYSKSIQEFWSRWHISLSNWFRDYLFLPIAYAVTRKLKNKPLLGIKSENWSYITGISITMLICGLWHGADWTFILWGSIHAFFLVFAFITKKLRKKIIKKAGLEKSIAIKVFKTVITFILITIAWVFFRAVSVSSGFYIVSHFFSSFNPVNVMLIFGSRIEVITVVSLVIILELIHYIQKRYGLILFLNSRPVWQRWGIYYFFVFLILIFGRFDSASFIYAKF